MIQETDIITRTSNKRNDSHESFTTYWSILKKFLNNKKNSDYSTFLRKQMCNRFSMKTDFTKKA